ncbi:TetR/AcrR family transcriptional regulator [Pseudohalioglobus sediminis]|uniref:TetR/AcrR family transcriptional regulator n=1 Tax=Pseudohalioglobus sediminis TaxID=2606449 RepID=A0A5B0X559_9GAMM|nr:TetR/AcrR family transcriptional regulator [Pseudohalioglobus sediminis]KAA1193319.1 TetR/AcrR family transcriptional regulator [Pseudohalioglobus sediminis]
MTAAANRHAQRSAETRRRFIATAQKLFATRSIDGVSVNQLTAAAGQRNRNALQYHFGGKEGLVQAILDTHADAVGELRRAYTSATNLSALTPAEAAARVLVIPLQQYLDAHPEGVYYVQILSQLAATNSNRTNPQSRSRLTFRDIPELERLMGGAMAHLEPAEARRRLFLVISITFHGIADSCRAAPGNSAAGRRERSALLQQVIACISALMAAPARD